MNAARIWERVKKPTAFHPERSGVSAFLSHRTGDCKFLAAPGMTKSADFYPAEAQATAAAQGGVMATFFSTSFLLS